MVWGWPGLAERKTRIHTSVTPMIVATARADCAAVGVVPWAARRRLERARVHG